MRILILTPNVGRTAPGIVFERLIHGLARFHAIDLLTSNFDPSIDMSGVTRTIIVKKRYTHPRISKLLLTLFGVDPLDRLWVFNALRRLNKTEISNYDLVFSFLSFHHYHALHAGVHLAKNYNKKLAVYSVDAVPAPIGWLKYDLFYKALSKLIRKNLAEVDGFFSANPQMLAYQLTKFSRKGTTITDVIYNPSFPNLKHLPPNLDKVSRFVYTGGIYGLRKAEYVLDAFEKLLAEYPDSELLFIGSKLPPSSMSYLRSETVRKIRIIPYARDLTTYYNSATALIDIDADLENDVFLSSKMTNYLIVNRMIITVTGSNSPSRHLFKNLDSILQCDHDSNQIYEAMVKAISLKGMTDYADRTTVLKLFSLESIISRLNSNLGTIIASNSLNPNI